MNTEKPVPHADLDDAERALDALLVALIAERAKASPDHEPTTSAFRFGWSEPLPTRAQSQVRALAEKPVNAALRLAIRYIGQRLFDLTGNIEGMRNAAERVADMDGKNYGRRISIINSAWDGIGSATGGHWMA